MKKRLKIVEEFSDNKKSNKKNYFKKIDRNIYFERYANGSRNGRVFIIKVCPITKKIYTNGWSLTSYSYNEAIYRAQIDLKIINTRAELGLPLKYYTIKYWINKDKNEYILL
jgi:hypothetical protein